MQWFDDDEEKQLFSQAWSFSRPPQFRKNSVSWRARVILRQRQYWHWKRACKSAALFKGVQLLLILCIWIMCTFPVSHFCQIWKFMNCSIDKVRNWKICLSGCSEPFWNVFSLAEVRKLMFVHLLMKTYCRGEGVDLLANQVRRWGRSGETLWKRIINICQFICKFNCRGNRKGQERYFVVNKIFLFCSFVVFCLLLLLFLFSSPSPKTIIILFS